MSNGYWSKVLDQRLTRRRSLAAAGAATAAAAFLAACGGGDSSSDSAKSDANSLVAKPEDTTAVARKGGTYKTSATADVRSFEPFLRDISVTNHILRAYQTLVRNKPTAFGPAPYDSLEGEAAESWEYSPDKLTLSFKLQANNKFDPRPPISGRTMDANDVVYSWQRFAEVSTVRADLVNSLNPSAPVLSVSAPDSRTFVMKLAFPSAELLTLLRNSSSANLQIVPKESDKIDLRGDMRGSGAWYLTEYVPSSRFAYARNPNYYDAKQPFMDKLEIPIITEYATGLSQFKAGALYTWAVRSEDLLQTKKDVSALNMTAGDVTGAGYFLFWGFQDKSQFRDERVRQAFVKAIDRELWIDTFYNVSAYRKEGLPVETRWNSSVTAGFAPYWLDPQGKDFGPNAQYYKFDLAESKKLLAAAGYASGLDIEAPTVQTAQYGTTFPNYVTTILGMSQDAGFRPKPIGVDYNTEWGPKVRDAKGNFNGVSAMLAGPQSRAYIFGVYNKEGSLFKGFDPDGKGTFKGDPYLDDMTNKLVSEFDVKKAVDIAHEIQRYDAKKMYAPQFPGGANGFSLSWPVLRNFGIYRSDVMLRYLWLDETREPLKKPS